MLEKKLLFLKLVIFSVRIYFDTIRRSLIIKLNHCRYRISWCTSKESSATPESSNSERNIVIVGASFAGYYAARLIATSLPPNNPYRVVVIEPHSHFHFTWVLPRFCVVPGHEHKAFIPYGPYIADQPTGSIHWIQDRVELVEREFVQLKNSAEKVSYDFLIVATGSGAGGGIDGLPSRVDSDSKSGAINLLRAMQNNIANAQKLVVVGGGASGVELASDTKGLYPDKEVTLVHSRMSLMHRFGMELQAAALEGLEKLGIKVILGERVVTGSTENGFVALSSGTTIRCDLLINCVGQNPVTSLLSGLTPDSITPTGHVSVKPTMQIADDTLSNIYACGDVADTGTRNPNSRAAMQQAKIAADNVVLAARGKSPRYKYKHHWAESVIKLTLGLEKSITSFGNGKSELLFPGKDTDLALMCDGSWKHWRVEPFEDEFEDEVSRKDSTTQNT